MSTETTQPAIDKLITEETLSDIMSRTKENSPTISSHPVITELKKLAEQYKDLQISGVEDKDGYARVHAARMVCKNTRVHIGKVLKGKLEGLKKTKEDYELAADILTEEIIPVETYLEREETKIDQEKARIRQEIFQKEQDRIAREKQEELDRLAEIERQRLQAEFNRKEEERLKKEAEIELARLQNLQAAQKLADDMAAFQKQKKAQEDEIARQQLELTQAREKILQQEKKRQEEEALKTQEIEKDLEELASETNFPAVSKIVEDGEFVESPVAAGPLPTVEYYVKKELEGLPRLIAADRDRLRHLGQIVLDYVDGDSLELKTKQASAIFIDFQQEIQAAVNKLNKSSNQL